MESIQLARYFADFLSRFGGEKIEIIETKNNKLFKHLVVCTAKDKTMAQELLVDLISFAKNEFNILHVGLEGYKKADWVVVDFSNVIVHIFQPQTRQNFCLEKLWK